MSSSQRRAGQLSCLSAWGPLLDVPVDRDGHLCGFLAAGALRGGLAGAAAELMGLSRRRFRLEGSVRGSTGKLGQTSTNFKVKHGKSASIMGIDDSLPGNAAPHLVSF